MNSLNIVFAGTPDFAAHTLAAIIGSQHQISAVYTQPDRPAGRGKKLLASPVKALATEHNLIVEQPLNFKETDAIAQLSNYKPDVLVVAAYGLILPKAVLDIPRLACINVHASLLPRWRGAAPIQRSILAGDTETGITIMEMAEGLDTGDMLLKQSLSIDDNNAAQLHDKLAELGAVLCLQALNNLEELLVNKQQQNNDDAIYAKKLEKKESLIDWHQDARDIFLKIRASNSWPVASTTIEEKTLRIWDADMETSNQTKEPPGAIVAIENKKIKVAANNGYLLLKKIQLPGGKVLAVQDILNSKRDLFRAGIILGQ